MQNRRAGTKVADEPPRNPEQAFAVTLSQDIQKQLQALNLSNNDFLKILTAQQNRTQPMNFNVAVLAKTPLDAMQISEKIKMIWGEQVICVPETIQTYKSTSYHLTVIDPDLVPSLHASANVIMEDGFTYSHDFPAGAD